MRALKEARVGVVGAGTMGAGIAQVAAEAGHEVTLFDVDRDAVSLAADRLARIMDRLVEKGRRTREAADALQARIRSADGLESMADCGLVIEAVAEDLTLKQNLFAQLESFVQQDAVLGTNTSSLSVTAVAAACERPERVLGVHFFNPAPLLPLVEVVPGMATAPEEVTAIEGLMNEWGKVPVVARDTPGFIVNRVARPFYGEALRLLEEGVTDCATIDWSMREIGGFRMGPFELMDLIGNDVNYTVTETVFHAFYGDPRYRPAFTQKRMVEAGRLGRKVGHGYYRYENGQAVDNDPTCNDGLGHMIFGRILCMLINEAADAVFWRVADAEDIDLAMTKGVNYPKGLLKWADDIGIRTVLGRLEELQHEYGEDRYRPSPMLRRMAAAGETFYG